MKEYLVNIRSQANGDNEVHLEKCPHVPVTYNRMFLGKFNACQEAIKKAKEMGYKKSNGCAHCCSPCHTQSL